MSATIVASIRECVAARDGMKLVNVKFFRGDRDLLSAGELRAEAARLAQARNEGKVVQAKSAPKSTRPRVDVREFIANL